jgi:hypothetical protein
MKRIILLILLFAFCISAHSQILRGRIVDQNTSNAISFSSAFFNGTFTGTLADQNGYFDPFGISWSGEMSKQRIADQLPYDYKLKK